MKKPNPTKLTLRRETLRSLAAIDLAHAVGGDATLPRDTGAAMCPAPVVIAVPPRD